MPNSDVDYSLYLVTDPDLPGGRARVADAVRAAVAGGVTVVQLRDKEATDAQVRQSAEELLPFLTEAGVPLFINDRVAVARELGSHVHIGQDDQPLTQVRQLLGRDQLIGLSVGSDAELDAIDPAEIPDVIGIGPVFDTTTKKDAPAGLGPQKAARLATRAKQRGIRCVAIGGITPENAPALAGSDFDGICVVSAIMAAADPKSAAENLKEAMK